MASFADTVRFCFPAAVGGSQPKELPLTNRDGTEAMPNRRDPLDWNDEDLSRGVVKFSFVAAIKTYAPDWILVAALWGVLAVLNRSPGHKREFSLEDKSIQHSFAEHERVPPNLLGFVSAGVPLLVLIPLSSAIARSRWDLHNSIIGLFMSYTMTGVVTQIIKMSVGRPRPDLLARCLPPAGATDHPLFGLSTVDICTSTNKLRLDDGFKSFPSGHSSLSFAGLGFLALYFAGKMHLWDSRGHRTRAWFALSPLLGALMVAISRTEDNRHHWQDVLVGSLLGLFIAWVAYRTYFPPLSHRQCHLPLTPKHPESGLVNSSDSDDEEMGRNARVRLLPDDREAMPRASEEEVAWRR